VTEKGRVRGKNILLPFARLTFMLRQTLNYAGRFLRAKICLTLDERRKDERRYNVFKTLFCLEIKHSTKLRTLTVRENIRKIPLRTSPNSPSVSFFCSLKVKSHLPILLLSKS